MVEAGDTQESGRVGRQVREALLCPVPQEDDEGPRGQADCACGSVCSGVTTEEVRSLEEILGP